MSSDATDQVTAGEIFREAISLLEDEGVDYAVSGSIATEFWTKGVKRIADIDVVIREKDSQRILKRLADAGYRSEEMEHSWLHKAHKGGVTIDLIFELANKAVLDEEMLAHRTRGEMFGTHPYVISAEDQVATLAAVVRRDTVGAQWYSLIDLMANNDLDWDYLLARSQEIPLRMLSVIYFALGEAVPVKKGVIEELSKLVADKT
jgi:hypothetical protein